MIPVLGPGGTRDAEHSTAVPDEVVRAVLAGGDPDAIGDLFDRMWYHLPALYGQEVLAAVSTLDHGELEKHPRLLVAGHAAYGFAHGGFVTGWRLQSFHESWAARSAQTWRTFARPGDVISAGGTAFIGARLAGDFEASQSIATEVEARVIELAGMQSPWDQLPAARPGWIASQKSLTALLAGDSDFAATEALRGYRESDHDVYRNWLVPSNAGQIALLAALRGHTALAADWLSRHEGEPVLPHISHLALLPGRLARVHVAIDELDRDAATAALADVGRGTDSVELWPFVAAAHARYGAAFGDVRAALAALDEAHFSRGLQPRGSEIGGFVLARARADLLVASGDVDGVVALRKRIPAATALAVPGALAALRAGEPAAAAEIAQRGLRDEPGPRDAASLSVVLAVSALRLGDEQSALDVARSVFGADGTRRDRSVFLGLERADVAALAALVGAPDPLEGTDVAAPVRARSVGSSIRGSGLPLPDSSTVLRDRLASLIPPDARLIVVRGEGGAGKSTFAAEWVARHRHDEAIAVWIPFSELGRSPNSAWFRIASVLRGRGLLGPGDALSAFISGEVDVAELPALIVERLLARGERVRVVLDDVHVLDESAQESLIRVMEGTELLTVLVTARSSTRFDDPVLAARTRAVTVTSADLAATEHEVLDLAERAGVRLESEQVERLMAATGGNMLAVRVAIAEVGRIAALARPTPRELERLIARATRRAILPEFESERDRAAALRLSLAPSLTMPLAELLVDGEDVATLLDEFQRSGLGSYRDDPDGARFSFHVLVADALRDEAERSIPSDELRRLRRDIAADLERSGDPVAAIGMLVELGDYDDVWRVVVEAFSELSLHRSDDVTRILETIPETVLESTGTLAAALAIMLSERESTTSVRVRRLVDAALRSLPELPATDDPAEQYRRHLARFGALRVARKYEDATAAGEAAIAHARRHAGEVGRADSPSISIGMLQLAVTEVLAGRLSSAVTHTHELAHADHLGRESHRLSLLAEANAIQGDMHEVEEALRAADAVDAPEWKRSILSVATHVARAVLLTEQGEPRAALGVLHAVSSRVSRSEHWPYVLWARAVARLAAGQAVIGLDELAIGLRRNRGRGASSFALDLVTATRADLYLATGRADRAAALLAQAGEAPAVALARARVELAGGHAAEALRVLDTVDWDDAAPRQAAEMLLLSGVLRRRLGHEDAAREALARAGYLANNTGLVLPLMMVPRAELLSAGVAVPDALAGMVDPFATLADRPRLTPREREVLDELVLTRATDQIAARFHVSQNTIKSQLKSLYRKLGASTRGEALDAARRHGLL